MLMYVKSVVYLFLVDIIRCVANEPEFVYKAQNFKESSCKILASFSELRPITLRLGTDAFCWKLSDESLCN
jgi:hypothetical protein